MLRGARWRLWRGAAGARACGSGGREAPRPHSSFPHAPAHTCQLPLARPANRRASCCWELRDSPSVIPCVSVSVTALVVARQRGLPRRTPHVQRTRITTAAGYKVVRTIFFENRRPGPG